MVNKLSVWVIAGKRAGQRNSCFGVAAKINPEYKTIKQRDILDAGSLEAYLQKYFGNGFEYPDIVISTGKDSDNNHKYAMEIKELSGGKTKALSINYPPRFLTRKFDFVAADRSASFQLVNNPIEVTGVPHKLTKEGNKAAAERPEMQYLRDSIKPKKPLFLALIGGDIDEDHVLTIEEARKAGQRIRNVVENHEGQLLATNSPRISIEAWRAMREELEPVAAFIYDCRQVSVTNPYMAMMGQENLSAVFVTGDSISMCCEACVPEKPAYIMDLPGLHNTYYANIHADIYSKGHALPFEEIEANGLPIEWQIKTPLDEAGRIAEHVINVVATLRSGGYFAGGIHFQPKQASTNIGR